MDFGKIAADILEKVATGFVAGVQGRPQANEDHSTTHISTDSHIHMDNTSHSNTTFNINIRY